MAKEYLGDSVYAEAPYGVLVLTTENGYSPTNRIVLEVEVYHNLLAYVKRLEAEADAAPPESPR